MTTGVRAEVGVCITGDVADVGETDASDWRAWVGGVTGIWMAETAGRRKLLL